jgi:hypothetical protein
MPGQVVNIMHNITCQPAVQDCKTLSHAILVTLLGEVKVIQVLSKIKIFQFN